MKWVGSHFKQYFILLALQADDSRCAEGAECLTPGKNEGDASMQTVLCCADRLTAPVSLITAVRPSFAQLRETPEETVIHFPAPAPLITAVRPSFAQLREISEETATPLLLKR